MVKPIVVGVVGCGYWGPNLIRNFQGLSGCTLKAVCDVKRERLSHIRGLYPEVELYSDYAKMLNTAGLDAVVIATSARLHHPMAKASLEAGKHTFIEKPMATSVSECEDLLRVAEGRGLTLMVGHTFLFSPAVTKIKEIVDSGDLGELRYICARRLNLGLIQKDINVVWDLAPHDISIILHMMGELPVSVNCRGSGHFAKGIEEVASTFLMFRNGRSAIIHSSWLDPHKVREMTIVGSKKMVVYDDVAPLEKIKVFDARVEKPPHYDTFAEFNYAYHYGDTYSPYLKLEEPLKVECRHFLDCISQRKRPNTDGRRGLELVRILEATTASLAQDGKAVFLPDPEGSGRSNRAPSERDLNTIHHNSEDLSGAVAGATTASR